MPLLHQPRHHKRRVTTARPLFSTIPTPRQIKQFLDQYVIGQDNAKKALAVAVSLLRDPQTRAALDQINRARLQANGQGAVLADTPSW